MLLKLVKKLTISAIPFLRTPQMFEPVIKDLESSLKEYMAFSAGR